MAEKQKIKNLSMTNDDDIKTLSEELKKFVGAQSLSQQIQGKQYVNVEAWQYAGSRLGLMPRVVDTTLLSNDDELKASAKVELWDLERNVMVGSGFGLCSNKEQGKKFYQEFAIYSMSQTRATSKAYRVALGFLMKMAGFEATPSEEMDYEGNTSEPAKKEAKVVPLKVEKEEPVTEQAPAVAYASQKQKEEIIQLLNNPVITRQEKTKMLLNINRFDEERAAEAIAKLKKVIQERESEPVK